MVSLWLRVCWAKRQRRRRWPRSNITQFGVNSFCLEFPFFDQQIRQPQELTHHHINDDDMKKLPIVCRLWYIHKTKVYKVLPSLKVVHKIVYIFAICSININKTEPNLFRNVDKNTHNVTSPLYWQRRCVDSIQTTILPLSDIENKRTTSYIHITTYWKYSMHVHICILMCFSIQWYEYANEKLLLHVFLLITQFVRSNLVSNVYWIQLLESIAFCMTYLPPETAQIGLSDRYNACVRKTPRW